MILFKSLAKPMSNIRSASSKISTSTLLKETAFWSCKSNNLPGVATKISTPLLKVAIWGLAFTPPKTTADFMSTYLLYSLTLSCTCAANSLVGVKTNARKGLYFACLVSDKYCNTGKVKPAVFPVPVWAEANISFPSKIGGIAFCWIGEGVVYPFSSTAFTKAADKPKSLNDMYNI